MSVGLTLKVVAGLAVAVLAAVLLENYGLVERTSLVVPEAPEAPKRILRPFPAPGDKNTGILWGLQISDLHISKYFDRGRVTDLEKFCSETVDIIRPVIVLVTGDLTDSLKRDHLGTMQHEAEWQAYQNVLKKTRVTEKTKWLDIRGNHDSFNIPDLESIQNYYRRYSALRRHGQMLYTHKTPFGNYSFIYVDATLNPGPKKPFNFIGILNKKQMKELTFLSWKSRHSNHTIWFGHYPTSTIISTSPGIRILMSSATAYMCGHLHLLGGLMPVLHARHPKGTLELELGDWKKNRRYRIFAFDHDLFSFADLIFDKWPVVLITNPKSFRYSSSKHEPLEKLLSSTHIRILTFSPSSIMSVEVKINEVYLGNAVHLSGPIYILKWDPEKYNKGTHKINVTVKDSNGRIGSTEHQFSIKGDTPIKFDFMPSYVLLTDHYIVARVFFVLTVMVPQLLLVIFRYFREIKLKGPLFIGEIIDGKMGCCFSFGIFVDGHFFQGSMTFIIGIVQMLLFNLPLLAYLCWTLLLRCQGYNFSSHLHGRYCKILPVHIIMLLLYLCQLFNCALLKWTNGTVALLFSPMYAWFALLAPIIIHWAWILSPNDIRSFIMELRSYQSTLRQ
ncbi:transmembrane protein 62 isoform X2 [Gracilinanus agilis]|uniref:transmembrane protein 62 isoform X2 n=1 Tax=Gracilinanus agilis TaxID=191870 RepID=UPI001CFC9B5E|nr:transmembrane protein 62 isoform X2 [Gracilinanus agilis]